MPTNVQNRRPPGRPRLQETEDAILSAAFEELCRAGYEGMTVDAVARTAGVGKPTIYRRYHDKRELTSAALSARLRPPVEVETGSLRGDLIQLFTRDLAWLRNPEATHLIGILLSERKADPWLADSLRRKVIEPRQVQYARAVSRALSRGEVNHQANPPLIAMALWGSLVAALLAGMTPNQFGTEALVQMLLDGIGQ